MARYLLIKVSDTDWKEDAMLNGLKSLGRIMSEEETLAKFREVFYQGISDGGSYGDFDKDFDEYAKENL